MTICLSTEVEPQVVQLNSATVPSARQFSNNDALNPDEPSGHSGRLGKLRKAAAARVAAAGNYEDAGTPPEVTELREAQFSTSTWRKE